MTTKTQTLPEAAGFLYSEAPGDRSRDAITVKSAEDLVAGAIITGVDGTVAATADAGNIGDGTMAATPVGKAGVKAGDYELVVTAKVASAGDFELHDPDGVLVGTGNVAAAFDNQLAFTLQDGGTDFEVGDRFTITVEDPKWIERAATDVARGVLLADVDATGGDTAGVAVVRDAVVNDAELVHVTGATDAQKATGKRHLARAGIVAR